MENKIVVVLTCFNRKQKTVKCIKDISNGNKNCDFDFVVVDDGSTDGTVLELKIMSKEYSIHIIEGTGNLYYSGGMRLGMKYILEKSSKYDYLLMINDDVVFFENSIEKIIKQSVNNSVIVGAMADEKGNLSYGAIKFSDDLRSFRRLETSENKVKADTLNANCVLIPYNIFLEVGYIDEVYIHSLGDFDYGLEIKRHGFDIFTSDFYVGLCTRNPIEGTWIDNSLNLFLRYKKKKSPKGDPDIQNFYFWKKNFGVTVAIRKVVRSYIRLIFKV